MSEENTKPREELRKEVIIVGSTGESAAAKLLMSNIANAIEFFIGEHPDCNITPLVLTKTGSFNAVSHFLKESKIWKEQKEVFKYVNDPEKVAAVFKNAQLLYGNVQKVDKYFGLKDVVDNTNLNYKGAQQVLDLVYAFGLLGKKTIDNRIMYKVFINQDERKRFIEERIREQEEILGNFKAMLDMEIATEIKIENEEIKELPADKPEVVGEVNGQA